MLGVKPSDLAKGFNLAGFTKEDTKAALQNSKFKTGLESVVEEFGNFNMATTGLKGKFNTMKEGASKLGATLKGKLVSGAKSAWTTLGKLKTVAAANPLVTGLGAAAVVGFGVYKAYQAHKENRLQDASEAADTWQSKDQSISDQISQYEELKTQLDSGVASAQEEYSIRQQILKREIYQAWHISHSHVFSYFTHPIFQATTYTRTSDTGSFFLMLLSSQTVHILVLLS